MDQWNPAMMQQVNWKEIRKDFKQANPELSNIIDELDPDPSYTIYDINYRYGDEPLKNGQLYLPNEKGELQPLNEMNSKIQEDLSYNLGTNPVSLVLKGNFELFLKFESHTAPVYGLIPEGKLFGIWRVLMPNICHTPRFIWEMTAGARSIFMLPKISEALGHKRLLNLFDSDLLPPKKLVDQWRIFKEFSHHPNFNQKWSARILFFSKKWFEKLDDPKWLKFKMHLLKTGWESSDFWRNQYIWDMVFSIIQKNTNLRPNPHHMDTAKHILTMAVGAVPGFSPAINDNAAPVSRLQELYQDVYRLEYAPIIMVPSSFSMYKNDHPVYYSIEYPSAIEFSPSSRAFSNKIIVLSDLIRLLRKCTEEIKKNYLNLSETPIHDLINKVRFDAFHTERNPYQGIRNSAEMPKEDPSFLEVTKFCKDKTFPSKCSFLNGCIRVSSSGT